MATLSVLTSPLPSESASALIEALLSWYVPFFAMIYIVRSNDDVVFILKVICVCAILIAVAGLMEFRLQRNFFADIFPSGTLAQLIENNPTLAGLLPGPNHFRNGLYRAESIFVTPLSFGEFQIIVIPIGLFFALCRDNLFERGVGWAVTFGGIIGIFCSGARGAYIGVLVSVAVFTTIWSIRKAMNNKVSLAPAIVGLTGLVSFAVVIGLIIFWKRAHNMVLGGGDAAASNNGRYEQWLVGIPLIESNPITGHGFIQGGYLINTSIDSYVLSLLIETGIPGLVFFFGLLLLPIWYGLRNSLYDMSESGAVSGALVCSFIAFATNRLVLSQRENHMLIFSLLAIVIVMNYEYSRRQVPERVIYKSPRKTHLPGG
jgi:O-antigen ligase